MLKRQVSEVSEKAASVARASKQEVSQAAAAVKGGEDVMSVAVRSISRRNDKLDRFLHCCANVGYEWADEKRVPLLWICVLLGAGVFGCAVGGAFGLGDAAMLHLPWGKYDSVPARPASLEWWLCGETDESVAEVKACHEWFYDLAANTHLTKHLQATNACGSNLHNCQHDLLHARAAEPLTNVSYHLNQWGLCMFPEEAWVDEMFHNHVRNADRSAEGGYCRRWQTFSLPPDIPGHAVPATTRGLGECEL